MGFGDVTAVELAGPDTSGETESVHRSLDRWRKFTPDRQRRMRAALAELARAPALSRDVREIVTKSLED